MSLSRSEIRDTASCPKCRAAIGKPCRHSGKGAAAKMARGSSHHARQVIAQRLVKEQKLPGMRATVITDASHCRKTGAGGWAAWIRIDGDDSPIKMSGPLRTVTTRSDEAEIRAALNGIHIARAHGARSVLVQTDCMTVVHLIYGKIRSRSLLKIWNSAVATARVDLVGVSARHVKGHTAKDDARFFVNRWCDRQARKEMRAMRAELERAE
ncbi:ribonuclease HI [Roseovarius nitratireducens]|uniref:ribonuclease HI n=1 Tax=Roseovarius nitratireducens TaxID=2044597 RepID=UPI0013ECAF8E|nr:reverse transcriptase-like protein [Roseovarius nitratireducens]